MAATITTGLTITFQSGFFAEILSVTGPSAAREAINTSHMGTASNAHTFTPANLVDWGELSVELIFAPGTSPVTAMTAAAETVTINMPDTGTATWAISGFMTSFEPTGSLDDKMTASATIKFTGAPLISP